ncbi:MAG: prepilin-type N-terminal cleavage/methylation domain-containing protein [Phycisphaerae bacterium]
MSSRKGWTLVELLVVLAVIALLLGVLLPAVWTIRDRARLASCSGSMRGVHQALLSYVAGNNQRFPPFAFSDFRGANLPLSSHWGGTGESGDPGGFGRSGTDSVNLWVLVDERYIAQQRLICPSEESAVVEGSASHFPYTFRFSSYALRFPPSEDLFARARKLAYFAGRQVLQIYSARAGGQNVPIGRSRLRVPVVRLDKVYRLVEPIGGEFRPMQDAVLADQFWRQDHSEPAPGSPGPRTYPVRARWCHGGKFNVAFGGGAVKTIEDDDTVRANTVPPGETLEDDGLYWSTYSERVWGFFDHGR